MWLLKLHIAISILCWMSIRGMLVLFKERYERYRVERKSSFKERMCIYFCPIVNIYFSIVLLYMAFASDEFVEKVNGCEEI